MATHRARFLVVSEDAQRRSAVCAALELGGYRCEGVGSVSAIEAQVEGAAAVLLDVTARSMGTAEAEQGLVRTVVQGRCPIVLFGERDDDPLAEVADVDVARLHIPWDEGGKTLLAFLRRLVTSTGGGVDRPRAGGETESSHPTNRPARSDDALRILVVDDSEMTLDLVQAQLTASGYDVRIALSFAELSAIVAGFEPDVVVVNVKRPDVPVWKLCASLRTRARRALVLLSSSMHEDTLASLARMSGADGWASKRLGVEAFVGQISAHLAGRARARGEERRELPR